jgi:hypothetical protein
MTEVKVRIDDKNTFVGAMARALADKIGGHQTVSGATDGRLEIYGFLTFHFQSEHKAQQFRKAISDYLGVHGAVAD